MYMMYISLHWHHDASNTQPYSHSTTFYCGGDWSAGCSFFCFIPATRPDGNVRNQEHKVKNYWRNFPRGNTATVTAALGNTLQLAASN